MLIIEGILTAIIFIAFVLALENFNRGNKRK